MDYKPFLPLLPLVFLSLWMLFLAFQSPIMRTFNLVDKRKLMGSNDQYQKLNAIMEGSEDFSLFTYLDSYSITASFKMSKAKKVTLRSDEKSFDKAVNKIYKIALEGGYIK